MLSSHVLLQCDLEHDVSWWLCTDKFDRQTLLQITSQDSLQLRNSFLSRRYLVKQKSIGFLYFILKQSFNMNDTGSGFVLSIFMRAQGILGFTSFKTNFTLITRGLNVCGFNMFKSVSFPFISLSTVQTHPLAIVCFLDLSSYDVIQV